MAFFSPGLGRHNDAPAGAPPPVPAPGVVLFDRYRLDERLGLGGMAEVWRARDEQLNRAVAIKILHHHLLPDARSRERFAAEARAVVGLTHPGIVTVHDIVVDSQYAAMVLELVDGETISDVIARRGRLPEGAAAAITAQVAHALQAAHDRGLVHRDVKPANVLLSPDGRARLVDIGIARMLDDRESNLTLPGTIMGTLRYMAPEQLADGAADRTTDVFGLGSLLYEMLVARPPFPAATPAALMAQQRQGSPSIHGASPELAGLARMALQHDPERRPRTAGRMAELLEHWLEHGGVSSSDLAAVTMAAVSGSPMPRPAPIVTPAPILTPAPIVTPAPIGRLEAASPAAPVRRRAKARAGPSADEAVLLFAPPSALTAPDAPPELSLPNPSAAPARLAPTGDASVDVGMGPVPGAAGGLYGSRDLDTAAVTATRASRLTPLAIGRRRVPLIAAVGLAGLLLVGLLLAGALAALQAGTARPTATPPLAAPTVTMVPGTPRAIATPVITPGPLIVTATNPPSGKPPKDPPKRRKND